MKVILFTMKTGATIEFGQLTGLKNPENEAILDSSATTAMAIDDRIQGYVIVDREKPQAGMMSEGIIRVREYGGTYIARFRGKTASCTASGEVAAQRVAAKVMRSKHHVVEHIEGSNGTRYQVLSK